MPDGVLGPPGRAIRESLILVVDDEPAVCEEVVGFLTRNGYRCAAVHSAAAAIEMMEHRPVAVCFADIEMPGAMNGIGLGHWIVKNRPETSVILTSGKFPWISAGSPLARVPFLPKPADLAKLLTLLPQHVREARPLSQVA